MYAFSVALTKNNLKVELKPTGQTPFIAQVGSAPGGGAEAAAAGRASTASGVPAGQAQQPLASHLAALRRAGEPRASPDDGRPTPGAAPQLPIDESLGKAHAFHYTQCTIWKTLEGDKDVWAFDKVRACWLHARPVEACTACLQGWQRCRHAPRIHPSVRAHASWGHPPLRLPHAQRFHTSLEESLDIKALETPPAWQPGVWKTVEGALRWWRLHALPAAVRVRCRLPDYLSCLPAHCPCRQAHQRGPAPRCGVHDRSNERRHRDAQTAACETMSSLISRWGLCTLPVTVTHSTVECSLLQDWA